MLRLQPYNHERFVQCDHVEFTFGGLIYTCINGYNTQGAVEFAVAASALKHSIEGDYNMVNFAEVEKLTGGDGSGCIRR